MSLARKLLDAGQGAAGLAWNGGLVRPVPPTAAGRLAVAAVRHGPAASALLGLSAARWPDRTCVSDDDGSTTYAEVYGRTGHLAGALRSRGVTRGSRVGVMCRNHVGFLVASFAAMWADADLVLLNTDFGGPQLRGVVAAEGLDVLLHDAEFAQVVADSGFRGPVAVADGDGPESIRAWERAGHRPPRGGGRHGSLVILTSGTTGTPKGSQRAPDGLGAVAPVSSLLQGIGLRSGDPVLVLSPLFHGFGLAYFLMALAMGCPVSVTRRFDAASVLERIGRERVQVMFAVPVMLSRLLDLPDDTRAAADVSSLRAVQSGAAPLSPDLARRFMDEFGDVLFNVYGSTETGWSTLATPRDLREAPGTVGTPLRGVSLRFLDADDHDVPAGDVGVIHVSSGMTAPTYTHGGGKRVVDGYVSTGDLGHRDGAGRVFVDGRDDDMIVSGGENVFPGEVEDLLGAHPGVSEAFVHGVPDDEFGQRLRAEVVLVEGATLSADDVRAYVKEHLARFKVPRDVEFSSGLARTATGKVKRVR